MDVFNIEHHQAAQKPCAFFQSEQKIQGNEKYLMIAVKFISSSFLVHTKKVSPHYFPLQQV
jgi:hypothetical protein